MIINENGIEYDVLAKIDDNKISYLTISNKNEIYFFSEIEKGKLIEEGHITNKYYTDENTVSELSYITKEVCYKIWFRDYTTKSEEEFYDNMKCKIVLDYERSLKKILKINLYKDRIVNKNLLKWKNNFEDKVYEINAKEFYIDDEEFDIYYKITDEDEYKFEFVDK